MGVMRKSGTRGHAVRGASDGGAEGIWGATAQACADRLFDSACEIIDFWRFNVYFAQELLNEQPISDHTMWNRLEYRGLEGFVYAVTPFNFTSIAANLPTAPALMGNTVVWKPASSAMYSAYQLMKLYKAAGIREYWVVDLKAKQVHYFIAPAYKRRTLSENISPLAWP